MTPIQFQLSCLLSFFGGRGGDPSRPHLIFFTHPEIQCLIALSCSCGLTSMTKDKNHSFLGCIHNIDRHVQPINISAPEPVDNIA